MSRPKANIRKYHAISWSWTIALCIALITYSEAVRLWAVLHSLILCAGIMTPKVAHILQPRKKILSWILGAITLTIAGIEIPNIRNFSDVATIMVEVIVGFLPISLLYRDKEVSHWLSLLNTTIIAIGCMLFKGDLIVYLLLLGFLTAVLFNLNSANMYLLSKGEPEQKEPLPHGFFKQFFATIPIGIIAGALIFFAFPRVKSIGKILNVKEGNNRTGYTGEIDLQGGRPIDESSALAFTVVSEGSDWLIRDGWTLLFRGTSLATFDGKKWLPSPGDKSLYANQELRVSQKHKTDAETLQIFMEPTAAEAIFYPGALLNISRLPKNVGNIFVDDFANVVRTETNRTRFAYEVQVFPPLEANVLSRHPLKDLVAEAKKSRNSKILPYLLNEDTYDIFVALPENIKSAEWFSNWTKEVKIDPKTATVSEAMRLLKSHFQDKFEGSLINQFSSANTFKAFLTIDKRGHCEYFATAAALFFRKLGLPSRVVLGYRGGRYNHVAKTLEVREESAHAWVELFIPGSGWVSYDPTPISPPTAVSFESSVIMNYINAAKFWFNRYVVDYDRGTQRDLIQSIQDLGYKKGSDQWSVVEWFKKVSLPILGGTGGIILFLFAFRFANMKKKWIKTPSYYRYYTSFLGKRGLKRETGESLRSFHERLPEDIRQRLLHQDIANAIEKDLYSPDPIPDLSREQLLKRLKKELRAG